MDNKYLTLNEMQQKAVFKTEGPVLILAGAGSGKTRVLTHRISYLIEEKNVAPWSILAITFTNKAAKEMKERVSKLLGYEGNNLWVSTFHSSCVRILRRHIDKLGYDRSFVIYDTEDQKTLMRECLKQLNINDKNFSPKNCMSVISSSKDELKSPKKFEKDAIGDFRLETISKIYNLYQNKLKSNNALDFDDIIFKTVELFTSRPDVLEEYQEKFKYVMVDEYQDTNTAQYQLIHLLALKYRNLCVVGDDDQSIYKFRGANIRNILDFEKDFDDAFVIRLEQNYRCTKNILNAANYVIKNNESRKSKTLWTDNETGQPIKLYNGQNEKDEAQYIADVILEGVENNNNAFKDYAILYRTNAQSRVLEEKCMRRNIPYRLYGGVPFYQRKEIKDILAYMRSVANTADDLSIKRIINVPRRGIGATTVNRIEEYAIMNGMDFYSVLQLTDEIPIFQRTSKKLKTFANFIAVLKLEESTMSVTELVEDIINKTSYSDYIKKNYPDDCDDRIQNINELISKVAEYEQNVEKATLRGLLEEISLVAAIDNYEEDADAISLMTLHSAKGLEFPIVFIAGMEEGLFPSYMSIMSGNPEDVEEERRLCYVGITRAQKDLYITHAKSRMIRGQTQYSRQSRFLEEIPEEFLEEQQLENNIKDFLLDDNKLSYKDYYKKRLKNKTTSNSLPTPKNVKLNFKIGDLVKHNKFGLGTVKDIQPGGADYQLTILFTKVGEKKLLASLSGVKKAEM